MRAWLYVIALAGCMKTSEKYCELHAADDPDYCHYAPDGPGGTCETSADCAEPLPACATDMHVCVECLDDGGCTAAAAGPVCLPTHACGTCSAHSECLSGACLPSGACAAESDVAYVSDQNAGGMMCTKDMPCASVEEARKRQRPYIKIHGAIVEMGPTTFDQDVTVLADPGARLSRMDDGSIVEVKGSAEVGIYDLEISGAKGTGSAGILMINGTPALTLERVLLAGNRGLGLSATTGSVTMHRSIVVGNDGGGASLTGADFVIANNLFVQNGQQVPAGGSSTGGLTLAGGTTTNVFAYNTVADNQSSIATAGSRGINCTIALTVANSLIINDPAGNQCNVQHSMFEPTGPSGGTNIKGDPMFRSTDATTPRSPMFYRIDSASAAKNAADPDPSVTDDIDGDHRPQDGAPDIGADEFTP